MDIIGLLCSGRGAGRRHVGPLQPASKAGKTGRQISVSSAPAEVKARRECEAASSGYGCKFLAPFFVVLKKNYEKASDLIG